jgi:alpha-tubulin suppressor-like RCC1 family protein
MLRRKVIARTITVRNGLRRPRFSRAMPMVVMAIATAAPCLSNPASATAGTTPNCLRGIPSPSDNVPVVCTRLLPLASTTRMRFGGMEYNYQGPEGQIVSLTVPSPTFNSATASPAELREAGVPPEPPSSSPEYPKWEAMIKAGIQFARPEATLEQRVEQLPAPSAGATDPAGTPPLKQSAASTETWSGYFEWGGEGHFTKADLYYKDPANKHNSCETNGAETETSIWAGLGGNYEEAPLAQTGTLMGNSIGKGPIKEQEAWFEVPNGEPARPEPYKMPLTVEPGHWVQADVQYNGHEEFSFFVENLHRNLATHAIGHGKVDANVADFIIERTAPENLVNFGDVQMQGFTNNKPYATSRPKIQRETLVNANGEAMAKPGQPLNNYEFFDKYENRCLDEAFGTGLQGDAESLPPTATTEPAESVGGSTATLKGVVNPEGQEARYSFEYGTGEYNYSESTPELSAGSGSSPVNVSRAVTGLSPGTTYHYRIIADGAGGIVAGADHTFKTTGTPPPPPPTVTTEGASGIMAHTATVGATVNPNGADTHYYFEYGTVSTLYESDAPALPGNDAGSGTTPVKVNVGVSGLAPYTTYYYRVVASNSTGTSYGTEQKFTTLATGTFSAGAYHTCALVSSGGSIDCWGYNYDGELGNGTTKNISTKPVAVSGITTATEVSAGGYHTCALLSGSIDCWGYNKFGELGTGTTKGSSTPVAVSGITNAIEVSGGDFYTCALLSTKSIDCWGENGFGELGDGTFTERTTPVAVHGITNATEVTAGALSTCALLSGGSIDCWGYNGFGELGTGSTVPEYSPTPVAVKGITNAVAVSAVGDFYTCALLSGGTIKCWGDNEDGELGNGTTVNSTTPVQVTGITNAAGVAAGAFHTCAWLVTATAYCWGENYFGELGNGTTVNSSTPVQVSGITSAAGVTAGTSHTCARLIGGSIDCWGENLDGQLGNGTTTNSSTPVAVSGLP